MKRSRKFIATLLVLVTMTCGCAEAATGTETPKSTPTSTAVSKEAPAPTSTPTPTDTPTPTSISTPTNTPAPTSTPTPTNTPAPTSTPIPTNTPKPTNTPIPEPKYKYEYDESAGGCYVEIQTDEQYAALEAYCRKHQGESDYDFIEFMELEYAKTRVFIPNGVILTGYNGTDEELVIPATIDGHQVVAVQGVDVPDEVKSIKIPNSVIYLLYGAFWSRHTLESITVPGTVKYIDKYALDMSIRKIVIEEGVETICALAFGDDYCFEELFLPASVRSIRAGFGESYDAKSKKRGLFPDRMLFDPLWMNESGTITVHTVKGSYADKWLYDEFAPYCEIRTFADANYWFGRRYSVKDGVIRFEEDLGALAYN